MKFGIIGGKGVMGSIFKNVFESQGYTCEISDKNTKLTNQDIVKSCDAVIFSLPISETVRVIDELVPLVRKEQILMDLTSLKEAPLKAMLSSAAEVLGLHPMFGPGLESVKGQLILYCEGRKLDKTENVLGILGNAGFALKECPAERHDKLMGVIQGLNHLASIVTAHALKDTGYKLSELNQFGTPVFKIRSCLLSRLMAQSPELYADMSISNRHAKELAAVLKRNTDDICRILESGDKDSFVKFFSEASDYFAENKETEVEQSNQLIQYFSKS